MINRTFQQTRSVGIKGHAVADAVAEAPKGVARALLYILSLLLHPSFKTFYHTFHHAAPLIFIILVTANISRLPQYLGKYLPYTPPISRLPRRCVTHSWEGNMTSLNGYFSFCPIFKMFDSIEPQEPVL